jgi:hypothetical protein
MIFTSGIANGHVMTMAMAAFGVTLAVIAVLAGVSAMIGIRGEDPTSRGAR